MTETISIDGNGSVIECIGSIVRQILPAGELKHADAVVHRIAASGHVCDLVDEPWNSVPEPQRAEIIREIQVAVALPAILHGADDTLH